MYFPRYWANAKVDGTDRSGKPMQVEAWGWSEISPADAEQKAEVRARLALTRIPGPKTSRDVYYEDVSRPFREPVLETLQPGGVPMIITRNSLGCDILNSPTLAFADIDCEIATVSWLDRLFGQARRKQAAHRAAWEADVLARLRTWPETNAQLGFRIYRTCGGLRLLATTRLFPAGTEESRAWLESVGSDPLYIKLCQNQKSYRARLTPKPWRCGCRQLAIRFPYKSDVAAELQRWLANYRSQSDKYAVCELLETVGPTTMPNVLSLAVDLHDRRTKAESGLPLA